MVRVLEAVRRGPACAAFRGEPGGGERGDGVPVRARGEGDGGLQHADVSGQADDRATKDFEPAKADATQAIAHTG